MDKSNFFRATTQPNSLKTLKKSLLNPNQPNPTRESTQLTYAQLWVRGTRNFLALSGQRRRAAAVTTVDMCWTVVCRVRKMYARCLIVILVVALAQIFPTGIVACGKTTSKNYVNIDACDNGCCGWCKQRGYPKCQCKFLNSTATCQCAKVIKNSTLTQRPIVSRPGGSVWTRRATNQRFWLTVYMYTSVQFGGGEPPLTLSCQH